MKHEQLNSHEINEIISKSSQKSKSRKSIFYECNIYTLKHIVESSSGNPIILREILLQYSRLSQPYVTDMVITHNFLTEEEIILDINRESVQDICERVKNHEEDDNDYAPTDQIIRTQKQNQLCQEDIIFASQPAKAVSDPNLERVNKSQSQSSLAPLLCYNGQKTPKNLKKPKTINNANILNSNSIYLDDESKEILGKNNTEKFQDYFENQLRNCDTVYNIKDNPNDDDESSQDKNQITVKELVLFKKRSANKGETTAEKSQTNFQFLDDIKLNQLKKITFLLNSSPKQDQLLFNQILLSDQEYSRILCSIMEVLGVTAAECIKTLIKSLNLDKVSNNRLLYLLFVKTHKYDQMIKRYFEPVDNPVNDNNNNIYISSFLDSMNQPSKMLFQSPYDLVLEKIYNLYCDLLNQKKSIADVEELIQKMLTLIAEATSNQASQILSTTEVLNLTALQEMFAISKEYFTEQLNDLLNRKFFFSNEIVQYLPANLFQFVVSNCSETQDELQLMQLTHYQYFDKKFIFYLLISMNALANSKGGVCFLGIHNIYPRVKGISIKEIAEHSFIQVIRKNSFSNHPPIHFDINLLKVESISEKDKSKDNFVIKIHVFPRKSNVVYEFKDKWSSQVFVRNKGANLRLTEEQVEYLQKRRNIEKDIPDFQDYIEVISVTHDNSKEKRNSQVNNLTMPCAIENDEHTQKEQAKNSSDNSQSLCTIGQINSKREEIISSRTGRLKRSLSKYTKAYFQRQNEEIKHRQKSRLSFNLGPQSLPYPSTSDKLSSYNCKDQRTRNCTEKQSSSGSGGGFQHKSLSSLIDYPKKRTSPIPSTRKDPLPSKIDTLLQSHSLRGIEQWKKNILIKNLTQDSIPTFPEFKLNHPLKATESELFQMLPNQCFMIKNNEKGREIIQKEKFGEDRRVDRQYGGSNSRQFCCKKRV